MTDPFHCSGNSSFFQIELISLWCSEWIVLPPALINSAGIWTISSNLCLFTFSIAISTSRALGSSTSGSAVCISVYLQQNTYLRGMWLCLYKLNRSRFSCIKYPLVTLPTSIIILLQCCQGHKPFSQISHQNLVPIFYLKANN